MTRIIIHVYSVFIRHVSPQNTKIIEDNNAKQSEAKKEKNCNFITCGEIYKKEKVVKVVPTKYMYLYETRGAANKNFSMLMLYSRRMWPPFALLRNNRKLANETPGRQELKWERKPCLRLHAKETTERVCLHCISMKRSSYLVTRTHGVYLKSVPNTRGYAIVCS